MICFLKYRLENKKIVIRITSDILQLIFFAFFRDGDVVKGSNLTIVHVSDIDYNRKFMCLLASPQMMQGESRIVVTLKKGKA